LGDQLQAAREAEDSEEALARLLGLDPGTMVAWERRQVKRPYARIRQVFENWLARVPATLRAHPKPHATKRWC